MGVELEVVGINEADIVADYLYVGDYKIKLPSMDGIIIM